MKEESIKVNIDGQDYWFLQETDGGGPVAPLIHCDKEGNLNIANMFSSDTFAHVGSDRIVRRYGAILGKIDDFIPLLNKNK